MAAQPFAIQLNRPTQRRLFLTLSSINVFFAATTGLFIYLWARLDELPNALRTFTKYWLVQGHLATENVIAAWYSSMLLLIVAVAATTAFACDRRGAGRLRYGWLVFAAVFTLLSLDEIGSFHERVGMLRALPRAGGAVGWVYVLAIPILAVAAFMLAFAWAHLRRAPGAFPLMAAGVAMFLMNPVLEAVEMAMIHGAGQVQGTWQRTLHDVLLVLEEGVLELFGILCFLAAVLTYIRRAAGESLWWTVDRGVALRTSRAGTLLFVTGTILSGWIVTKLPAGDTGIAENWYPAAAWLSVALVVAARADGDRRVKPLGTACAIAISAGFGAGLYGYVDWLVSSARWHIPVAGVCAAGLALELAFRSNGRYFFSLSPRSSIASPTLRRPRPNPS